MAAELPGAVVSPATAQRLGAEVRTRRIVVLPVEGEPVDPEALRQAAKEVVDGLSDANGTPLGPPPEDESDAAADAFEDALSPAEVFMGDDSAEIGRDGPLNDVPVLAGTLDQARGRMAFLAALALLVTLAATVLALGWTRAEDAVLDLQGAGTGLRAALGAGQALVLAGSASAVGALAGIGLPAVGFRVYESKGYDLPPIPLVVPIEVAAVLVALPLVAAAATALVVALRPAPGPSTLDRELAW